MLSWMLFLRLERRYNICFQHHPKVFLFSVQAESLTICQGLYNIEKDFGVDKQNANILDSSAKWRHGIYDGSMKRFCAEKQREVNHTDLFSVHLWSLSIQRFSKISGDSFRQNECKTVWLCYAQGSLNVNSGTGTTKSSSLLWRRCHCTNQTLITCRFSMCSSVWSSQGTHMSHADVTKLKLPSSYFLLAFSINGK